LGAAAVQVDRWLGRVGIPFGSTPHSALAGHAVARNGDPEAGETMAQDALLRALEHKVLVDEVAARRVLARLAEGRGDAMRARYQRTRGAALISQHHLHAWREALDRLLQPGPPHSP
jgi:hypothetical protein